MYQFHLLSNSLQILLWNLQHLFTVITAINRQEYITLSRFLLELWPFFYLKSSYLFPRVMPFLDLKNVVQPTPPTPYKILMPNLVWNNHQHMILCAPKKEVTQYLFPKFTFPLIFLELLKILFWKVIVVLSIIRQHHIPSSVNVTVILTKLSPFFRLIIFPKIHISLNIFCLKT